MPTYIRFDGVDGESKDTDHKKWIDILSDGSATAGADADSFKFHAVDTDDVSPIDALRVINEIKPASTREEGHTEADSGPVAMEELTLNCEGVDWAG